MLTIIFTREIRDHLISPKFLIGLGLATLLMATGTVINLENYRQRQQDCLDARRDLQNESPASGVSVFRPPENLSVLVQGNDRKLGTRITINYMRSPSRLSGYMGQYIQYTPDYLRLMSGFEAVDFAFIVRVILSLMVVFLAYNSVSEEKSLGTLRLVLSNPIPRDQLLLGKFLGGLAVILGALSVSALVSMLALVLSPSISLAAADWARIGGMLAASALYLTAFYSLGLFVSVLVDRPSVSLMILLQAWIFLVIISPNLGVVAAENLYPVPGPEELARMKETSFQPHEAEFREVREDFIRAVSGSGDVSRELGSRWVELWSMKSESDYRVDQELDRRLNRQVRLAHALSLFSPAVLYDLCMSRLARTDLGEYERFMGSVFRLWQSEAERTRLRYQDRDAFRKSSPAALDYVPEGAAQSLRSVSLAGCALFFFGVVFFSLAYTGFLRKDVR